MKPFPHAPHAPGAATSAKQRKQAEQEKEEEEEEEDDYMTMSFADVPTSTSTSRHQPPETSLQRRQRERREAEARARPRSKAELAAEAEARREAAQATSLLEPKGGQAKTSKGLAMMAKMGFRGGALGVESGGGGGGGGGLVEPIRVAARDGREGIGLESERKRKMAEAAERAGEAAKRARVDEGEYRDRVRREREEARLERLVGAAQKVAERMDEEEEAEAEIGKGSVQDAEEEAETEEDDDDDDEATGEATTNENTNTKKKKKNPKKRPQPAISSRPLKSIPVEWRGLVRAREAAERDRRMRHDLEQGLSRLPTYEDADEDADDRRALGRSSAADTVYVAADDLDDEDAELEAFEALGAAEKLARLVAYLRARHRYCFWCKYAYPDARMDGCPGVTEEDHD